MLWVTEAANCEASPYDANYSLMRNSWRRANFKRNNTAAMFHKDFPHRTMPGIFLFQFQEYLFDTELRPGGWHANNDELFTHELKRHACKPEKLEILLE